MHGPFFLSNNLGKIFRNLILTNKKERKKTIRIARKSLVLIYQSLE